MTEDSNGVEGLVDSQSGLELIELSGNTCVDLEVLKILLSKLLE